MNSSVRRIAFLCFIVTAFASGALLAQPGSTDVPNWTVPPYHPARAEGGLTTMTDNSPGVLFVGMQPCRVFDTRGAVGPYGGPRLIANVTRNFDIDSGPCGPIPGLVQAYSMNFGAILADGDGFITIWPAGAAQPVVSAMNTLAGEVIANAAIVPAGAGGAISVFPNTGVHLYGDINGYFTQEANSGTGFQYFGWQSDNAGSFGAAIITNTNTGAGATFGLVARANSTGAGTAAVFGTAENAAGGITFGGRFQTNSTSFAAAGAKGVSGFGDPLPTTDCDPCYNSGVLGASAGRIGVTGMTRAGIAAGTGVLGVLLNAGAGVTSAAAAGYLGSEIGTDPGGGGPPWAVFGQGNIGASGIKPFLEPHPSDPSLIIQYIALEGPEAGTYFRGKGKFVRGMARIEVPEDFRMVSDPEGLSIQVTPIGEMATVAVVSIGLDEIVVKASRNVEFFYTVNGVRSTFKDVKPIRRGGEFRPEKASSTLPAYLSEGQKRLLIQNGTYRPDGAVNMETAQRLGWDRIWEARSHPQPQPEPPTSP